MVFQNPVRTSGSIMDIHLVVHKETSRLRFPREVRRTPACLALAAPLLTAGALFRALPRDFPTCKGRLGRKLLKSGWAVFGFLGVDFPFSTTSCFPKDLGCFLERRMPGKNGEGTPRGMPCFQRSTYRWHKRIPEGSHISDNTPPASGVYCSPD